MYHVIELLLKDGAGGREGRVKNKTPRLQHCSKTQPVRLFGKACAQKGRKYNSEVNLFLKGKKVFNLCEK